MQAITRSSAALSVSAQTCRQRSFVAVQKLQQPSILCRAVHRTGKESEAQPSPSTESTTSLDDDALSRTEVQKLAELRREQQRGQSQMNIVQGAIEEASLITWPTPKKAMLDTVLVLGIVIASGSLLFGLNVLLAEGSEWWYHRG